MTYSEFIAFYKQILNAIEEASAEINNKDILVRLNRAAKRFIILFTQVEYDEKPNTDLLLKDDLRYIKTTPQFKDKAGLFDQVLILIEDKAGLTKLLVNEDDQERMTDALGKEYKNTEHKVCNHQGKASPSSIVAGLGRASTFRTESLKQTVDVNGRDEMHRNLVPIYYEQGTHHYTTHMFFLAEDVFKIAIKEVNNISNKTDVDTEWLLNCKRSLLQTLLGKYGIAKEDFEQNIEIISTTLAEANDLACQLVIFENEEGVKFKNEEDEKLYNATYSAIAEAFYVVHEKQTKAGLLNFEQSSRQLINVISMQQNVTTENEEDIDALDTYARDYLDLLVKHIPSRQENSTDNLAEHFGNIVAAILFFKRPLSQEVEKFLFDCLYNWCFYSTETGDVLKARIAIDTAFNMLETFDSEEWLTLNSHEETTKRRLKVLEAYNILSFAMNIKEANREEALNHYKAAVTLINEVMKSDNLNIPEKFITGINACHRVFTKLQGDILREYIVKGDIHNAFRVYGDMLLPFPQFKQFALGGFTKLIEMVSRVLVNERAIERDIYYDKLHDYLPRLKELYDLDPEEVKVLENKLATLPTLSNSLFSLYRSMASSPTRLTPTSFSLSPTHSSPEFISPTMPSPRKYNTPRSTPTNFMPVNFGSRSSPTKFTPANFNSRSSPTKVIPGNFIKPNPTKVIPAKINPIISSSSSSSSSPDSQDKDSTLGKRKRNGE